MSLSPSKFDNILVMGKSGAGKQPRINVFINEFGMKQLSTGNIFRSFMKTFNNSGFKGNINQFFDTKTNNFIPNDEIKKIISPSVDNTNIEDIVLGLKARYFVSGGHYVPDSLTNMLFESAFAKAGYKGLVLDGYPRTVVQAKFLLKLESEKGVKLDAILFVDNEDDIIIKRTMGRRICPSCGAVFHIDFKPPKDGKFCRKCGTEVVLRSDDTEEKLRIRLQEFQEKTVPAIKYLEEQGVTLVHAEGNLPDFTEEAVKESVIGCLRSAGLLK